MDKANLIWFNNEIIPWDDAKIHVMSHILHYGSGVFEGIKCYKTEDGSSVFRLKDHIERLFASAKLYNMEIPYSKEELLEGTLETIRVNRYEECYIRPIAFYGYDTLGVHPKECPVDVAIGVFFWGEYLGAGALTNGVRVTVSPWRKFHSSSMPTIAKCCGQYVNSMLAAKDARDKGFDEALMLNYEGTIAEGSGQNIFIIKDKVFYTNAEDSCILMGITRDTVIKMCVEMGYSVSIGKLSIGQLYSADEAFFTGTASEITPIREVDGRIIGKGKPGRITKEFQLAYFDIVKGRDINYQNWLTEVTNITSEVD